MQTTSFLNLQFLFLFWVIFCGVSAQHSENDLFHKASLEKIRQHVFQISSPEFEGRNNNTSGNAKAREYIIKELQSYGVEPLQQNNYTVPFSFWGSQGVNILGKIQGNDPQFAEEYVFLSAHYDHLGIHNGVFYPGANDNACGVSSLLEMARILAQHQKYLKRSICIAFFDAEEDTMRGSFHYTFFPIIPLSKIACVLDMDLLGRPFLDQFPQHLFVFGTEYSSVLRQIVQKSKSLTSMKVQLSGTDLIGIRCDYAPFWLRKVPFLFVTRGQQRAYHQPYDRPETIDYEGLYQSNLFIRDIAWQIATHLERPHFEKANYLLEEFQFCLDLLQALKKTNQYSGWLNTFLEYGQNQLEQILQRKKSSDSDRWILRSITAALLLNSFQEGLETVPISRQALENAIDAELDLILQEQQSKNKNK